MLRTALRPRWLALLAVVLAAAAVMARLGEWQLDRARQKGERDRVRAAQAKPAVPLTSIITPRTAFPQAAADRRVTVEGTWDAARQVLVPGRILGDATGLWVLTPLRLADGAGVPVVRGWVRGVEDPRADPAALPTGRVVIDGVLEPSEPVTDLAPGEAGSLPAGQVVRVAAPLLVRTWPYPLTTGYVVQTAGRPAATGQAATLAAVPPPGAGGGGLALQNLSYAVQWWLFSAFGIVFWWRLVRDDHRGRRRPTAAADGPPPVPQAVRDEPVPTPQAGERS